MQVCLIIIGMLIILNALLFYQFLGLKSAGVMFFYRLPFIFPVISAILTYLAFRSIKKDDDLVKSYDRLR
jgi:hypothetical protein